LITLTFIKNGIPKLGIKTDQGILDVQLAVDSMKQISNKERYPTSVQELVSGGTKTSETLHELISLARDNGENLFLHENEIEYGPCIINPQKIICVGLNYKPHVEESKMDLPKHPILFSKFSNALIGNKAEIKIPHNSKQVDYEGELAIVMGKEAKNVSKETALSYVYGYCNANDLSARDLQFLTPQWLLGKSCDGFCPLGPYLVSKDEIPDSNNLSIKTFVNGEIKQDSNTENMIFQCDELISFISQHMTLYPGDIILTGTPEGVILGYEENERVWLKDGDEVTVEIERLGSLTNRLIV
jgi:2-keto-4-pentenoate hydratase/2-oxohepta-3-ene-1,7-dioic acid hydratase in catechol pathway